MWRRPAPLDRQYQPQAVIHFVEGSGCHGPHPLGQYLPIQGNELGNVHDGRFGEAGVGPRQADVSGRVGQCDVGCDDSDDHGRDPAFIERVGLHDHHGTPIARAGSRRIGQGGPPDLASPAIHLRLPGFAGEHALLGGRERRVQFVAGCRVHCVELGSDLSRAATAEIG